jgi:hypothetical protein
MYGQVRCIYTSMANFKYVYALQGVVVAGGIYIGLARTIYIRCTYGIFGLKITKYTVYIYVYIRFWPTL